MLVQFPVEGAALVCDFDFRVVYLYKVSLHRHWLRILAKVLLPVVQRIDCDQLRSILAFHELAVDHSDLAFQVLDGQDIAVNVSGKDLLPHIGLDRVEVLLESIELQVLHTEVVLCVFHGFLLKDLGNERCQLVGLFHIIADFLLHESANVLPLAQSQVVIEVEAAYEGLDVDVERRHSDLAQVAIFDEAASECSQVFRLYAKLIVVLARSVRKDIDELCIVSTNFLNHLVNTRLLCGWTLRP